MKKSILLLVAMVTCMFTFAQIPTTGLIAYYPMGIPYSNVSPLTQHLDASGNSFHLNVTNGFGHGQGRTGTTGEAAEFNASNTDLRKYNYSSTQLDFQQTGDFTVSAWVRLGSPYANEYQTIVQVGANDIFLRFRHDGSSNYFIQGGYRTGASSFAVNSILITAANYFNTWRLVTLRKFGSNLQIFEGNANVLNSVTNASPVVYSASDKDFKVGNSTDVNTCFKGRIQDVFYYNRALTPTDFAQLACSATPPTNTTLLVNPYQSICAATTVQLQAQASPNTNPINWYTAPVGGAVFATNTTAINLGPVNSSVTYYIDATASNGCVSYARVPIEVTVIPAASAPTNTTPLANLTVCSGNTTSLIATGSSVTWYAGQSGGSSIGSGNSFTTPVIIGATTFYAQDGTGNCASPRTAIAITLAPSTTPPAPTSTTPTPNLTRCGGQTASLSVSGSGTIEWFNVPSGGTALGSGTTFTTPVLVNSTTPGTTTTVTYYAQASSGCGVSARTPIAVTVKYQYTITDVTPTANLQVCQGNTTTLSISTDAPDIEWAENNGGINGPVLGTSATYTTPPMSSGAFYLPIASGNSTLTCQAGVFITVNVLAAPAAPSNVTGSQSFCYGNSVQLDVVGTGTINWYDVPTGGTSLGTGSSYTTPALFSNAIYYAQATVGNCVSARTAIPLSFATPAPTNTTPTPALTVCSGIATTLSASGSGTLLWFDVPTGGISLGTTSSFNTGVLTANKTFYVQNVSSGCASARVPVAVTVNALPTAAVSPATAAVCNGSSITLTASGGTNYAWSNSGGSNAAATFSPTTNTTYTVTVTNATNCSATASKLVTVNALPNAAISPATVAICNGVSATLTVSGGTIYAWSNSGGSNAAATFSPTTNTTYTVTVTNANNCSATASKLVTVNANPTAAITPATATICEGTSATLTASGGASYAWSNSGGSNAQATFSPTTNTTYTVTVTNAANCSATASRLVTVNANPTAAITPSSAAICNGGSAVLSASGGGTYTWSNSGGSNAQATFSPSTNTTYTVTVTAANTCTATASRLVTVNALPSAAINGPTTICSGLPATLTASGGGTYAWSNSGGSNAQATFTPTQNTTYTVTVTGTGNCTATASQTLSVQLAPTATIRGASSVCAGSSITLTANGGNSYTWANGLGSNAGISVSPTVNTTYTVTVSVGANCTATATQTVTINQPAASTQSQTICQGATFTFNGQALAQSGDYYDTLQTIQGCDSILTLNLTVLNRIESTISAAICNGQSYDFKGQTLTQAGQYFDTLQAVLGCDSFIVLNLTVNSFIATGISESICQGASFTFNGEQLTAAGQYLDTLTSASSCDTILTLTLTVNDLPQPVITQNGNVLSTQTFDNYQWQLGGSDINGAQAQNYTSTANGNYTVEVTDANGCSATSASLNVTGVGIETVSNFNLSIYPNPANEFLIISCDEEIETTEVYNVVGEKVIFVKGQITKLNTAPLAQGMYSVQLKTTNGNTAVKKFIKQ